MGRFWSWVLLFFLIGIDLLKSFKVSVKFYTKSSSDFFSNLVLILVTCVPQEMCSFLLSCHIYVHEVINTIPYHYFLFGNTIILFFL